MKYAPGKHAVAKVVSYLVEGSGFALGLVGAAQGDVDSFVAGLTLYGLGKTGSLVTDLARDNQIESDSTSMEYFHEEYDHKFFENEHGRFWLGERISKLEIALSNQGSEEE